MRARMIALVVLAALFLGACGAQPAAVSPEIAAQAPATYVKPEVLVDTAWVKEHLSDPQVRLIDLSSKPETYAAGHIPGAQYLSIRTDLVNPDDPVEGQIATSEQIAAALGRVGVSNDHTIVLYDDNSNLQAARAYWALKYYRHADVRIYNGGTQRWKAEGNELVAEVVAVEPATYVPGEADPAIRTTWDYVISKVEDPSVVFCDTRGVAEYTGIDVRAERGGRIPGAANIEWKQAVNGDGTFKSAPELWKLYTEAGFTPDREIITYCQTGVRSAHTWFVLTELLGYDNVRNYDGSWAEYGNKAESVIE